MQTARSIKRFETRRPLFIFTLTSPPLPFQIHAIAMVRSVLFAALSLFLAATQAAAVVVARDDAPTTEISGTRFVSTPSTTTSEPAKRLSNAERIARGMPLAKPHRRFHGSMLIPRICIVRRRYSRRFDSLSSGRTRCNVQCP